MVQYWCNSPKRRSSKRRYFCSGLTGENFISFTKTISRIKLPHCKMDKKSIRIPFRHLVFQKVIQEVNGCRQLDNILHLM